MTITLNEAAAFLKSREDILILCHASPDGDTLGSGAALCLALRSLGKKAQVRCSDKIGKKFEFLFQELPEQEFTPKTIVAVDVADEKLLEEPLLSQWGGKVELCIDHHPSNMHYAERYYVDPKAAATCEIIYDLLKYLEVPLTLPIATAIYTGISTDTGCFRYINVTPKTHRIAAKLLECHVEASTINHLMFETKSRDRIRLEQQVLETLEFFAQNRIAVIAITRKMVEDSGISEEETEGLASLPRQIEGVRIGVTLREKADGSVKISLRALHPLNASNICAKFGGGGHPGAAGCSLQCSLEEAKKQIVGACEEVLDSE